MAIALCEIIVTDTPKTIDATVVAITDASQTGMHNNRVLGIGRLLWIC